MVRHLILYVSAAALFFSADFAWLTATAKPLYRRELGDALLAQPNLVVAGVFYLAYLAGLVILVIGPAGEDITRALWMGAVFGLVAYGTYDLTNLATLRGFTPTIAAIDLAWGTVLTAATSAFAVWVGRFFA